MCSAGGDLGRDGAVKRRILSFAEFPGGASVAIVAFGVSVEAGRA